MSQKNVETLRAMVTKFNRSGFLPEDLFDPDVELFNIRESPLPGPYRGYAGLLEWRQGVFEVIDDGRFEIDDVVDVDESDLVIYKNRLLGRARHSGIEIDISWTNVNWFREGRIYRSKSFTSRAEALKAVGLAEYAMSQESTTRDLVELTRQAFDAGSRHDIDAIMGFHVPGAIWDLSDLGLGTFDGSAAIRGFVEDWFATWQDLVLEAEEIVDLGQGVVFAPVREEGRPTASGGHVEQQRGWVTLWVEGNITRIVIYLEIDEARAAAERLAEERE